MKQQLSDIKKEKKKITQQNVFIFPLFVTPQVLQLLVTFLMDFFSILMHFISIELIVSQIKTYELDTIFFKARLENYVHANTT